MRDRSLSSRLVGTTAPASTLLIRLMVGGVFLSEGIQKFLYPAARGTGRFAKIGLPWPEVTASFVGGVEVVCGALLLAGLLTRLAALPLAIVMAVALATTKVPILLGSGYWGLHLREFSSRGVGKTLSSFIS